MKIESLGGQIRFGFDMLLSPINLSPAHFDARRETGETMGADASYKSAA